MKKPQKNYNSKIELGILIAFLGILLISTQANACCWPTRKSVIPADVIPAEDPSAFRVVSPLYFAKHATKIEIPTTLDAGNPYNVNSSTPRKAVIPAAVIPVENPSEFGAVLPLRLTKQATKEEMPVTIDAGNPCNVNSSTPTIGASLCDENPSGVPVPKAPSPPKLLPRALIVDDQSVKIQERFLKQLGFEVTVLTSGDDAIAFFKGGNVVDLVVMDYNMPGMTGFHATNSIRTAHPDLSALFFLY